MPKVTLTDGEDKRLLNEIKPWKKCPFFYAPQNPKPKSRIISLHTWL